MLLSCLSSYRHGLLIDPFRDHYKLKLLTLAEGAGAKAEAEATRAKETAAANFMVKIYLENCGCALTTNGYERFLRDDLPQASTTHVAV
jgi:hypothetical protein